MRIDQYLWCLRYYKSRNQASLACKQGHVRFGDQIVKPSREVLIGDKVKVRKNQIWHELNVMDIPKSRLGEFLPVLRSGDHTVNNDGTYEFDHYGQGVFFIPSILGYYESNLSSIPSYSPLIFSVALHKVNPADHDNDGILSRDEDPDGDGDPFNDDTDEDRNANFLDADDDNDGTPTREEYDRDGDGNPDDDDNDGIPDYLDQDSN